jgi:hypothetical protein
VTGIRNQIHRRLRGGALAPFWVVGQMVNGAQCAAIGDTAASDS